MEGHRGSRVSVESELYSRGRNHYVLGIVRRGPRTASEEVEILGIADVARKVRISGGGVEIDGRVAVLVVVCTPLISAVRIGGCLHSMVFQ